MADFGKSQSETYLTHKDMRWVAGALRELTPRVRNLGGKIVGGKMQWFRPHSDSVFADLDAEPDFAANAFFPVVRGYKARNEWVGYSLKLAVWDEGEYRRVGIGSYAGRQVDRMQASGARRRLVRMLAEVDDTLVLHNGEGAPIVDGPALGGSPLREQRPHSVARPSRRRLKVALTAALPVVLVVAAWFTMARPSDGPTSQQAAAPSAPTAGPAAKGLVSVPEVFAGTWVGTGYQYDNQSHWTISMSLRAGGQARAAGRITYPSLSCGGVLSLQTMEGGRLQVLEDITNGEAACIDNGSIDMWLLGETKLNWRWNNPDGTPGAEAILSKKD
jgi:hypothetical protein